MVGFFKFIHVGLILVILFVCKRRATPGKRFIELPQFDPSLKLNITIK